MPYPTISIDWTRGKGYEIDDIHALKYKKTICNPRLCGEVSEGLKERASKACVPTGYRGFESRPLRHPPLQAGLRLAGRSLVEDCAPKPAEDISKIDPEDQKKNPAPRRGIEKNGGSDEDRTRDLRIDSPAF